MLAEWDEVEYGGAKFKVGCVERHRIQSVRFTTVVVEVGGEDGSCSAGRLAAVGLAGFATRASMEGSAVVEAAPLIL